MRIDTPIARRVIENCADARIASRSARYGALRAATTDDHLSRAATAVRRWQEAEGELAADIRRFGGCSDVRTLAFTARARRLDAELAALGFTRESYEAALAERLPYRTIYMLGLGVH
jgi:hypothetical protein